MAGNLRDYIPRIEEYGRELGLDFYPVDFEEVPPAFMMEVAVYGLPVRMPHWSFGVRWIYQMVQHQMGHSRIFEVVFPGNPNRAYIVRNNSLVENLLVVSHVLGHADFSKNNLLFERSQREAGYHIVEQAAAHAHRIEEAVEQYGWTRVERVLDAALSLEQHIDTSQHLNRPAYTQPERENRDVLPGDPFRDRFGALPGETGAEITDSGAAPLKIPPSPERDLLWFIAHYAPEMEDWERDIFLAVREESYYFQPVFSCQIMNEGWACQWHARILREGGFMDDEMYVDAMKTHSDVVRPYAGDRQIALTINPYHLGFAIWDRIIRDRGETEARRVMVEEDDFGFVRNYLDADLARELDLFVYLAKQSGEVRVRETDLHELHEAILRPKYNFGAPRVYVDEFRSDGSLVLRHDHGGDGIGLDLEKARHVLDYVSAVWRRPVSLYTAGERGAEECLKSSKNG